MKYNTFTLRLLTGALCLPLLLCFFTLPVKADEVTLSLSPSVIHITTKVPADVSAPFIISNNSNQSISLTIGYKAFDPFASSNGFVVFPSTGQNFPEADQKIFQKMQIITDNNNSIDTVNLGPKQSKHLQLRITLPKQEPSNDYYFTLLFVQNSQKENFNNPGTSIEDQKSFSALQTGIGMNILLAVGDNQTPQGSIDSFGTSWFRDSGPTPFSLAIHNEGLHFITPQGTILIKNMFGQLVGKITIPNETILAGTSRTLSSIPSNTNASTSFGASSNSVQNQIIWPEKFLLGIYSATITISLSNNGPLYTRTIHFIAFPVGFLVTVILVILILVVIFLRLKRKISF